MNEDQSNQPRQTLIEPRAAAILAVAVVLAAGIFAFVWATERRAHQEASVRATEAAAAELKPVPPDAREAAAAAAHHAARSVAESRAARFYADVERVKARIARATEEAVAFERELRAFPESAAAGRTAAHDDLVRRYIAIDDAYTTLAMSDARAAASLASGVETLAATVKTNMADGRSAWSPEGVASEIAEIEKKADEIVERARGARAALAALAADATSRGGETSGDLREAVNRIMAERAQAFADAIRQERSRADAAVNEQILLSERRESRLREIAANPQAHELLWWLADGPYFEPNLAQLYHDHKLFADTVGYQINKIHTPTNRSTTTVYGPWNHSTTDRWNSLNERSKAVFSVELHELYRIVLMSESNRERFVTTRRRMTELLDEAKAAGDSKRIEEIAKSLQTTFSLPAARYP